MANTFTAVNGGGVGGAWQAGDSWSPTVADYVRQDLNVLAKLGCALPLQAAVQGVISTGYVDVPFQIDHEIVGAEAGGLSVVAVLWSYTTNASTSVQLRVRNVTDSSTVGTGTLTANTTPTREEVSVTLNAGTKRYALQITGSTGGSEVFGYGYLRLRST
jgi:hypothetical protein